MDIAIGLVGLILNGYILGKSLSAANQNFLTDDYICRMLLMFTIFTSSAGLGFAIMCLINEVI